jgi:CHAD domain-containing protein
MDDRKSPGTRTEREVMSYQLRRDEKVGHGLRRIARKQVEFALAIVKGEREPADTPVHETRKHLKKARAILQLVRKEIGRGPFKTQDHCLRDVGRLISEIRDAEVRLETARELRSISGSRKRRCYDGFEETLTLELESVLAAFAEWQVQAVPMLERVRKEIQAWPVEEFGFNQLRNRIQATYKRGRKALAEARKEDSAEAFHLVRKEAKRLYYQLRILTPSSPLVAKELDDELGTLGDLLGRAHDLSFLKARLQVEFDAEPANDAERQELLGVIEASEADLQQDAADLAEHFYAERPRDFGNQIATWLDDWCATKSASVADELVSSDGSLLGKAETLNAGGARIAGGKS